MTTLLGAYTANKACLAASTNPSSEGLVKSKCVRPSYPALGVN